MPTLSLTKTLIPVTILSLLIPFTKAEAATCDSDDLERLTSLANHVDFSYTYSKYDNSEYNPYQYDMYLYNFSLSNLTEELYALNSKNISSFKFDYQNNEDGKVIEYGLEGGEYSIDIYSKNCNKKLRTISLTLPYYNQYHNSEKCQEESYQDLDVCKEWTKNKIEFATYSTTIDNYDPNKDKDDNSNREDKILKFIQDNFLYFSLGAAFILLIIIIIIVSLIKKKRSELL